MTKKCIICEHEYVSCEAKICPDSHYDYTEYHTCPKCQYNPEIKPAICEIVGHMKIDACLHQGKLEFRVCTRELEEEILELIKKVWPKPKWVKND